MAFTQFPLLSPEEFVGRAAERGIGLTSEQLTEVARMRALVPVFRIAQHPRPNVDPVPVSPEALQRHPSSRSGLGLAVQAAQSRALLDPETARYRSWQPGIRLDGGEHDKPYPSTYFSHWQLLGLRPLEALASNIEVRHQADGRRTLSLHPLYPIEAAAFDAGRRVAVFLSAVDMHYLPHITLTVHHCDLWDDADKEFDVKERLKLFNVAPEDLAKVAESLLHTASSFDPMGSWYDLVRLAHPDSWQDLRGAALLAMDYRIAAEILLRCLDDIARTDLSTPPPRTGRIFKATLDDRLRTDRLDLDHALTDRGLSPHPSLLLILEGETEMVLMPKVLEELYGEPVPSSLIECFLMAGIDSKLDLLVRHAIGLRLGEPHGDWIGLTRPPTRVLVAVDKEKAYFTKEGQEKERTKLVGRLVDHVPAKLRNPRLYGDLNGLVEITTWGHIWEFANFTNRQLARAIMNCSIPPAGTTQDELLDLIETQRAIGGAPTKNGKSADITEILSDDWPHEFSKVGLADALWPVLQRKVRRAATTGHFIGNPAAKVGVQAVRTAIATHRRRVGIRAK